MADDPAQIFKDMVERIGKIDLSEFAGAAVVVPRDGEPIVFLLADPYPKAAQFWSGVSARVEVAAAEAQHTEQERAAAANPYGRPR